MRGAGNGKHASCDWGVRHLMQTALRRKTEMGNEKDPSAALGMTKRERRISQPFSNRCVSQSPPLRGTSFHRKEGELCPRTKAFPAWEGSDVRIPLSSVLSFRAQARNLFRLRSDGVCARTETGSLILHECGIRCFMQTDQQSW